MSEVAAANAETSEAWGGPLSELFIRFRPFVSRGLGAHSAVALEAHPPRQGDRVLDIGCGFGDSTRDLAALVGEGGEVVGVDISPPFLDLAAAEAREAGIANVDYRFGDVQIADLGGPYDYVFSRMGVMFFADPVAALRNVRGAMRPGARLNVVVWRRKVDNGWIWEVEQVVARHLENPAGDEGPGMFSMADADLVSGQLRSAGFESIELLRHDLPMRMGETLDKAVDLTMSLGPGGEALRLAGEDADELRPTLVTEIRAALERFDTGDGILAPSSTWIISAVA